MHKPISSELNWPMYCTHAIIIAKQREMKNWPVQEAKSKVVACFGSLGFPPSSASSRLSLSWVACSLSVFVSQRLCLFFFILFFSSGSVSSSLPPTSSARPPPTRPLLSCSFFWVYLLFVLFLVVFVPTVLSSPFVSVLPPLSQSAALLLLRSWVNGLSLNVTTRSRMML